MQEAVTAMSMEQVMTNVGEMVEASIGWITDFAGVITANPIIMAFVLIAFIGVSVGLIRRLISL